MFSDDRDNGSRHFIMHDDGGPRVRLEKGIRTL